MESVSGFVEEACVWLYVEKFRTEASVGEGQGERTEGREEAEADVVTSPGRGLGAGVGPAGCVLVWWFFPVIGQEIVSSATV